MFGWFKKDLDDTNKYGHYLSDGFIYLENTYAEKLPGLKIEAFDSAFSAEYEIRISWKITNDIRYFKVIIPYSSLSNKTSIGCILDNIINVLDKEAKVLKYRSDFEDLLK